MAYASVFMAGLVLLLGACAIHTDRPAPSPGQPESLLDTSVEKVTVPLDHAQGLDDLSMWVQSKRPSSALVQCAVNDMLCVNATRILSSANVPHVQQNTAGGNQVVLTYEKLIVRDCNQQYRDYTNNHYNVSSPAFGCSTASNIAQMVSDKQQFTNPALLGHVDGSKAAQTYSDYMAGPQDSNEASTSLLDEISTE